MLCIRKFLMAFWDVEYFLWGNKQIKNAVEAWEKTFSPAIFDPTCRSRDPSWSKGHDLYCVWSYFSNLFFHSKNGCTFSRSWKMLVMCISSSHNFFSQLEGQVSTSRGKNEPKTASLSKYLPNKKTRPTFAYFTHFLHFYLAHLLLCCVLFCRAFPRAYLWWEDPSFSTIVMRFFFAERFVNMTPHNSLEGPFTFRRVKIQKKYWGKKGVDFTMWKLW